MLLVLAAAPTSDPLTPLYVMVGLTFLTQFVASAFAFVKWLGNRAIEREDKDKADLRAALKEQDARFKELRESVDVRIEKQAEFYRNEIRQLEFSLRQDMSRAIADFRPRGEGK